MEEEAVSAMPLEYVHSSVVNVEMSPDPPSESTIQETNVDLPTRSSSTEHHDHPASELPTKVLQTTHSIGPKPKLESVVQCMHKNWKRALEMAILIGLVLIVWTLFSIPTILYGLPPIVRESESNFAGNVNQSESNCDQSVAYEGQVCLSELTRWQQCFSPQSDKVYLPSDINQQETEATANFLLLGLLTLSPSAECEAAIKPFMCLYLFGSCDSDNRPHQVTRTDCERLRDDVCSEEVVLAVDLLGEGVLPNCDDLLQQEEECQDNGSSMVLLESDPSMTGLTPEAITDNHSGIVCAEGYYLSSDEGFCRPLCSQWVDPPGVGLDAHNIAVLISVIIALFSSVTAIILALTIQRKTMLTFPTVYLVFFCATIAAIIAPIILIGFTSRKKLFCSSDDLSESFQEVTAFCTIAGMIITYGEAQVGFWVAFHAVELCWGVIFPYHFRRMKTERKIKYFHIIAILLALVFPILPAFINLHDGYIMADTPTTVCFGRSNTVTFFGLILPLSILIAVATSALIITFWKILKQFTLRSENKATSIGKAQAKILFVVCYYVVSGIMVLTVYSYYQVAGEANVQAVIRHFTCQSAGTQSGRDCGDVPDIHLEVFDSLLALSLVLIGLLPAVILVFMVKCNCNDKWCAKKNLSSTRITLNMQ